MSIPKADKIVPYVSYSTPSGAPNGVLHVFGDSSSSKIALLCPGFPDDHTIFLPFAKALSKHGIMAGVMCLPGYDDRPEDGIPWRSHPRAGFTYDETAKAVRDASKALCNTSTHEKPELIGIFHDWGVISGSIWAERLENEAQDNPQILCKPNKIVYFDVLAPPSSKMPDYIRNSEVAQLSNREKLNYLYQVVFAAASTIQLYLPRQIAAAFGLLGWGLLSILNIVPMEPFDFESRSPIYGNQRIDFQRWVSMMYMYRNTFTSGDLKAWRLHRDWKNTPILYMYGKEKKTHFHANNSVAMLQREKAEQRSLCRVVAMEGAGHWLYVQKEEESVKHVVDFILAENKFAT